MKIIYHCYGGAHSSVTAAAIHLNWLATDSAPESGDIRKLPYFDRPIKTDHGHIRFMGVDEWGNDIYVLGRRNVGKVFENISKGMMEIFRVPDTEIMLFDVMPYVNWKMVLGGFTSRRMGWVWFGRPVITLGVKHSFWKIVSLVQRVKICIARRQAI